MERNFDAFPVSRINEYPKQVNIAFFKSKRWITGAGEEAIPQIPPAICNAVFKITGKDHDLSWRESHGGSAFVGTRPTFRLCT